MKPTVFNYAEHVALQAELERVTAESDAAVKELKHLEVQILSDMLLQEET